MLFFFVRGLGQQGRQVLEAGAGRMLKFFFIPAWRWPGKDPLLHCNNCNLFFPQKFSLPKPPISAVLDILRCHFCSREVDPRFRFCPFCASAM
ncbi:hypothetical protein NMG60_11017685 [Bertholletia excelsa]